MEKRYLDDIDFALAGFIETIDHYFGESDLAVDKHYYQMFRGLLMAFSYILSNMKSNG